MKSKHTQGKWLLSNNHDNNEQVIRSNGNIICNMDVDRHKSCVNDKESEANAKLIAAAPELLQMVYDLKQCVKRLSQDGLSQHERDTESQWEGEAHELLRRINPDYYDNANKITTL